jgi:hypothetical protein
MPDFTLALILRGMPTTTIAREMRNLKLFRIIFKLSSVTDDVRTDSRQATTPRHAKPRHNMYRTVRM